MSSWFSVIGSLYGITIGFCIHASRLASVGSSWEVEAEAAIMWTLGGAVVGFIGGAVVERLAICRRYVRSGKHVRIWALIVLGIIALVAIAMYPAVLGPRD